MIIGIMGFMGSGKDTVSDLMVAEKDLTKLSFADSLKDVVSTVFGWDRDMLEGDTKESREFRNLVDEWWSDELDIPKFTPRKAMQLLGTELFREQFDADIWVKNSMRRASMNSTDVVFADVRFRNEAEAIREAGGTLIRVVRGNYPSWHTDALMASEGDEVAKMYMDGKYPNVHRSEWDCLSVREDFLIRNEGSLRELNEEVRKIYDELY